MQSLLRVLKEDVRVIAGAGRSRGNQDRGCLALGALTFFGQAVRSGQAQAPGFSGEKDGDARHQQRARQLLDDRLEQRLQIGFGAEAAAELDQGLAVVVAMAVEGAIDPALNAALEGIEDGRCDQNGNDQAPLAHRFRQALCTTRANQRDDAEVAAEDQRRWPACKPRRA